MILERVWSTLYYRQSIREPTLRVQYYVRCSLGLFTKRVIHSMIDRIIETIMKVDLLALFYIFLKILGFVDLMGGDME